MRVNECVYANSTLKITTQKVVLHSYQKSGKLTKQ
jgi:hypothetical protein